MRANEKKKTHPHTNTDTHTHLGQGQLCLHHSPLRATSVIVIIIVIVIAAPCVRRCRTILRSFIAVDGNGQRDLFHHGLAAVQSLNGKGRTSFQLHSK